MKREQQRIKKSIAKDVKGKSQGIQNEEERLYDLV